MFWFFLKKNAELVMTFEFQNDENFQTLQKETSWILRCFDFEDENERKMWKKDGGKRGKT